MTENEKYAEMRKHYCETCPIGFNRCSATKPQNCPLTNSDSEHEVAVAVDGDDYNNALNRLAEFEAIGTIEEFKALKEKNTPLEHHHTRIDDINDKVRVSVCPSCLSIIFTHSEEYPNFCVACGQKLDWSE